LKINKKGLLILAIVIIMAALGAVIYFLLKNNKPIVWDGNYTMTGDLACTGNFPNLTAIPMNTIITVSGNKIVDEQTGNSFDIDKRGRVTQIEEMTTQGITTKITAVYKFSKTGDTYKYTADGTADISTTQNGTDYVSKCTGVLNGAKQ